MRHPIFLLFLSFCLLTTACGSRRKAIVGGQPVVITVRDTIAVAAPVLPTENHEEAVFDWDGGNFADLLLVQDSASWAEVKVTADRESGKRKYSIRHGRKADTVYVQSIRVDTFRINPGCRPCQNPEPSGGGFPWSLVLAALGALCVWWVGKRAKRTEV